MYRKKYRSPGMPTKQTSTTSKMIAFRLPIEILPEWKAAAERKQMTASGFLVEALLKAIASANNDARQGCSTDTATTV